ncbi:MAG: PAS domain-containing hybrid sensor histidine kinase/response regulator [Methylacidiphilales bacterium]|nr:PAS domain-containing hybrid sensor histidine kinase/response regulator [Candidatus Methylacidiphilales bacterium]
MTGFIIGSLCIFLVISLFFIGKYSDNPNSFLHALSKKPYTYGLSLGVYCTAWTFYGLVGTATTSFYQFFPILLGPVILFIFAGKFITSIFERSRDAEHSTINDFISGLYAHNRLVSLSIACILTIAIIPYISLQLQAVSFIFEILATDYPNLQQQSVVITALAMILFVLFFGVRKFERHSFQPGLVNAVAFESLVKLVIMIIFMFVAIRLLSDLPSGELIQRHTTLINKPFSLLDFALNSFISAFSAICLPRMFHMIFSECQSRNNFNFGIRFFIFYLLIFIVSIWLLALLATNNTSLIHTSPDHLTVNMFLNSPILLALACLGGFSAATAMIIVSTTALSQIITNDLIFPFLFSSKHSDTFTVRGGKSILRTRKFVIITIIVSAWLVQINLPSSIALTQIGRLSFSLIAQLSPILLFGLYWKHARPISALITLVSSFVLWVWLQAVPLMTGEIIAISSLTILNNLLFSALLYVTTSVVLHFQIRSETTPVSPYPNLKLVDMRNILSKFTGDENTNQFLRTIIRNEDELLSGLDIGHCERYLSNFIGSTSARNVIISFQSNSGLAIAEATELLNTTTHALKQNYSLMQTMFDNIEIGIAVSNDRNNLVTWNRYYQSIYQYPDNFLFIGRPIRSILEYNAARGMFDTQYSKEHSVAKRLSYIQNGIAYTAIRRNLLNNKHIRIRGSALPGGGYITTYQDVTETVETQQVLERTVEARTNKIATINQKLIQEIEKQKQTEIKLRASNRHVAHINKNKTLYLSLLNHDVAQPINAALMYVNSLEQKQNNKVVLRLASNINTAIQSAQQIISDITTISNLDTLKETSVLASISLDEILESVINVTKAELSPNTTLVYKPCGLFVYSDPRLLHRVLQNLISNSVKYTPKGKINISFLVVNKQVIITIRDTGIGVRKDELKNIFRKRFRGTNATKQSGSGLGLTIARRFAEQIQAKLTFNSTLGKGSVCTITVPTAPYQEFDRTSPPPNHSKNKSSKYIYYIDDDKQCLQSMQELLQSWDLSIITSSKPHLPKQPPDVIIIDYHLYNSKQNGYTIALQCKKKFPEAIIAIVSADLTLPIKKFTRQGFAFIHKPIQPALLRALIASKLNG